MHPYKGKLIIIDGLDGIGKGVVERAIAELLSDKGKIFDLVSYWKENNQHPPYSMLRDYDILLSAEPTYTGIGKKIREELIVKGSTATPLETAQAYSDDRLILYNKIIIPALKDGKDIIQSRSVSTSLVYQRVQSDESITLNSLMNDFEGNKFALENAPDLLIIPTILNVAEVIKRLGGRKDFKDDNCRFENLEFQLKIKPHYESDELREIFESRGTIVKYLDAGISIEETKEQAIQIYLDFLKTA